MADDTISENPDEPVANNNEDNANTTTNKNDTNPNTNTNTNTNTNNEKKKSALTQSEIEKKLKSNFSNLSDGNVTTLAHYMYQHPNRWVNSDDVQVFKTNVNKIMPEAYAYNMRFSNILFGSLTTVLIMLVLALIWWLISLFSKNNSNKNVLIDPSLINPIYV